MVRIEHPRRQREWPVRIRWTCVAQPMEAKNSESFLRCFTMLLRSFVSVAGSRNGIPDEAPAPEPRYHDADCPRQGHAITAAEVSKTSALIRLDPPGETIVRQAGSSSNWGRQRGSLGKRCSATSRAVRLVAWASPDRKSDSAEACPNSIWQQAARGRFTTCSVGLPPETLTVRLPIDTERDSSPDCKLSTTGGVTRNLVARCLSKGRSANSRAAGRVTCAMATRPQAGSVDLAHASSVLHHGVDRMIGVCMHADESAPIF